MKNQPNTERESGMTLIELMIGVVIIVSALVPVLSLTTQHAKMRRVDNELGLAFSACSNNLEAVRGMAWADIFGLHGQGFDVLGVNGAAGGLRPVPGDPDGLPGEFSVTVEQSSGGETLYRVRATVEWTGVRGRQNFILETFVSNREST